MTDRSAFLDAFEALRGYRPYPAQEDAIFHDGAPLWILAGPGTGKTEVLVLRTLRLLLLDQVPPESIVLTTFTERAARSLHDRIAVYLDGLLAAAAFSKVERPDVSRLWLGTLHSIAHKLILEMDEDVDDLDLLDEAASKFVFLRGLRSRDTWGHEANALYETVAGREPQAWEQRPRRAQVLLGAVQRVVEDDLDRSALVARTPRHGVDSWPSAGIHEHFIGLLDGYEERLGPNVDFARVQSRLLAFLKSVRASAFLKGDSERQLPGIRHVIVDEYQDTNPVQEEIYFALASSAGNLTVVGDDDQALYRFRGASVDAIVQFPTRCLARLGRSPHEVTLGENRRSHERIVSAVNAYIGGTGPVERFGEARTQKGALTAKSAVSGAHHPVVVLVRDTASDLAGATADAVHELVKERKVTDLRQVALLCPSTRNTPKSPFRPWIDAFKGAGLALFNPGAKDLHRDVTLKAVLGAYLSILDPDDQYSARAGQGPATYARTCRRALDGLRGADDLRSWVSRQADRFDKPLIEEDPATGKLRGSPWFDDGFLDVFYRILGHEPYLREMDARGGPSAAVLSWRLGQMSGLLGSFGEAQASRGRVPRFSARSLSYFDFRSVDRPSSPRGIDPWFVDRFLRDMMSTFQAGGFDDAEDELMALPPQFVPALTIHQAKGLEFPIVFVCGITPHRGPGDAHCQEDLFRPYRKHPPEDDFSQAARSAHDEIRKYFVAYSRPQYALVICLERSVYHGVLDGTLSGQYPHLPASWLRALPVQ